MVGGEGGGVIENNLTEAQGRRGGGFVVANMNSEPLRLFRVEDADRARRQFRFGLVQGTLQVR